MFDPAVQTVFGELGPLDLGYRLLLLAHLLFVIVGFGSTFVWPFLGQEAGKRGGQEGLALSEVSIKYSPFLTTYAIYGAGLSGFALAIAVGRMDELWTQTSLGIFLVAIAFSAFVHVPNLKKMDALAHQLAAAPPPGAGSGGLPPQVAEMGARAKDAARNGGVLHLAFVVLLVLMIWQPGR
jgi:hypothetical protein